MMAVPCLSSSLKFPLAEWIGRKNKGDSLSVIKSSQGRLCRVLASRASHLRTVSHVLMVPYGTAIMKSVKQSYIQAEFEI